MSSTTRRRVLALSAGIVAGGIGVTQLSNNTEAQASISFDNFDLPSKTYYGTSPQDIILEVNAKYSYTANRPPSRWKLAVLVGTTSNSMSELTYMERVEGLENSNSDTVTLQGSLINTPNYQLDDFQTSSGNSVSKKLWCQLEFEVYDNSELATSASVLTDAVITVDGTSLSVDAQLGGTGGITVYQTES